MRTGYGVLDTEDAGSLQRADSIRHRAKRASLLVFGTSAMMMALIVYMVVTGDDQKQAASAPSKKPVATQLAALKKARQMEELDDTTEDNKADIHFGGTVLRKGYPGPLNIQTGYKIRPSKYGSATDMGQVYGYPWRPAGQFKDSSADNNGQPVADDQGPDYAGNPGDPEDFFGSHPPIGLASGDGVHCSPVNLVPTICLAFSQT